MDDYGSDVARRIGRATAEAMIEIHNAVRLGSGSETCRKRAGEPSSSWEYRSTSPCSPTSTAWG